MYIKSIAIIFRWHYTYYNIALCSFLVRAPFKSISLSFYNLSVLQKEGLFKEVKERQRFTKPAEMNKRRKNEAVRRERKRQWKEKQIIGF